MRQQDTKRPAWQYYYSLQISTPAGTKRTASGVTAVGQLPSAVGQLHSAAGGGNCANG
jgi:hypothetical protein